MKASAKATATMLILALAMSVFAEEKVKTINVDFTGEDGVQMKMSLPLSLVESIKQPIEQALADVQTENPGLNFSDIWASVKDSGPTEFVSIKSGDADVSVKTTETHLVVKIDEKNEGHNFDLSMPLTLCEALFNSLNDGFDVESVIDALLEIEGDLITLNSAGGEISGRVWIE